MTKEETIDAIERDYHDSNVSPYSIQAALLEAYEAGQANPKVDWIKIDGVDSLPERHAHYWFYRGKIDLLLFDPESEQSVQNLIKYCTHYAHITIPAPPEDVEEDEK